jgi:hypothetical protein
MKSIFVKSSAILLGLSFFLVSYSQDTYHTISGRLKDARTGEKISYATVTVPNTGIGTVSNSDGEFILKVDKALQASYFEISHLSYQTKRYEILQASGKENTYYLEIEPVELKEIPVIPDDARALVASALKNIRNNCSEAPNMMTGFYRESIMQNRDYISISEAVVDIYKAPYTTLESDQVRIFKGRKSSGTRKADTLLVQLQGGPNVLLLLDIVKNTDLGVAFDNLDNYRFGFEPVVNIDGELNWVVSFSPAVILDFPLYIGKLYIPQNNLAITRAEFSLDLRDPVKASAFFVQKKPIGLLFNPTSSGYLVTYKLQEGKYYLNYVRVDLKFRCDWKRKLFRNNYTLVSEMAITGRSSENIVKFQNQEQFRSNMIFTEKVQDFSDVDFWGEHNIIEPEKSIEEAIRKISRKLE